MAQVGQALRPAKRASTTRRDARLPQPQRRPSAVPREHLGSGGPTSPRPSADDSALVQHLDAEPASEPRAAAAPVPKSTLASASIDPHPTGLLSASSSRAKHRPRLWAEWARNSVSSAVMPTERARQPGRSGFTKLCSPPYHRRTAATKLDRRGRKHPSSPASGFRATNRSGAVRRQNREEPQ